MTSPYVLPVLPLRDIVVFPRMIVPLFVGREKSVLTLEAAMKEHRQVFMVAQKDVQPLDPTPEQLHTVGVIGTIMQILKLPDGTIKVLIEAGKRARLDIMRQTDPYFEADIVMVDEIPPAADQVDGLRRALLGQFDSYLKNNKKIPSELWGAVNQMDDMGRMADTMAAHISIQLPDKQKVLETLNINDRIDLVFGFMEGEIGQLNVEKDIRVRVKKQMEKSQREYYLNEQMKAIQKELAEGEDGVDEIGQIEKRIKDTKLSKEAADKAQAEVKKLRQMSLMSPEATVIRNYLDWLLSVPWDQPTMVSNDLAEAQDVLDHDHYGLEKIKDRIMEYLAVQHRAGKVKGPILCLVGPPGVGKTSLGQSVARATGRQFVRMSLGGVRDESEIRGHRRTYIGSQPGKIIHGMKKAKSSNPLFLLDEIDKLGSDWRGDPSAALLEVLDPEQNATFNDHYLEVDYDLSDVMFICTANSLNMPRPLLDRMEIIRLPGYTEDEKLEIAKRHLVKKQMEMSGLQPKEFTMNDGAIRVLIRHYTMEAGVRNLEREIANLCRKAIKDIIMKKRSAVRLTEKNVEKYAGVRKFRYNETERENRVGVVSGLAYTEFGGDLLSIEAVTMPGKDGHVSMTGNLKDVMKESITVAEMLIKSRARAVGVDYDSLKTLNIHVHVPEGATPKDGPSAGAAMTTAIISALTGIPVRRDTAMTGEVNLRGRVTEIGGLKEKLLAALRGGVQRVLIPQDNVKDLPEIPDSVKKDLDIIPVARIEDVFAAALERVPIALPPEDLSSLSMDLKPDGADHAGPAVPVVSGNLTGLRE